MRLLVLFLVLALPGAGAHADEDAPREGYLNHTEVLSGTLGPGQSRTTALAWEGAPFEAGWLWLWSGTADGPLELSLHHDGDLTEAWTWDGGLETYVLPEAGLYDLVLHNPGAKDVTYALHYDQTCDCTAKSLDQPGALWFVVHAPERAPVDLRFAVVPQALGDAPRGEVTGTFTVRAVPEGSAWKDGAPVTQVPFAIDAEDPDRLHVTHVPFDAQGGRHVVLMELDHEGQDWGFQIKPRWVVGEPAAAPAPWLPLAVLFIAWRMRR